ncbi:MAG: hypothetical protein ACRD28_05600 [Acidobacteriaceae bacterium]
MKNRLLFAACLIVSASLPLRAAILHAGPTRKYKTPCAALKVAKDGDTVLVDSAIYKGDVCAFWQNNLTVRGIGETRPHIEADGKIAEDRGIWVFHGRNFTVENMEFSGAHIEPRYNGSGLGAKGTNWTVRNCYFHDNQDGILESNIRQSHILIEYSEFARNGAGDGQSHNLYIGTTASLIFRFNYSHDANVGHLLKTRAAINYILYNRLSGENGTDSYEINVPNGGTTYVIGNIIEQGPNSQNPAMLDYLSEGTTAANAGHDLYVVNNTFVNDKPNSGPFIQVSSQDKSPVLVQNNIFYGPGKIINQPNAILKSNFSGNPLFVNEKNFNYHLKPGSPAIGAATSPGLSLDEYPLQPTYQYEHPACGERRLNAKDIGALAFKGVGASLDCR